MSKSSQAITTCSPFFVTMQYDDSLRAAVLHALRANAVALTYIDANDDPRVMVSKQSKEFSSKTSSLMTTCSCYCVRGWRDAEDRERNKHKLAALIFHCGKAKPQVLSLQTGGQQTIGTEKKS